MPDKKPLPEKPWKTNKATTKKAPTTTTAPTATTGATPPAATQPAAKLHLPKLPPTDMFSTLHPATCIVNPVDGTMPQHPPGADVQDAVLLRHVFAALPHLESREVLSAVKAVSPLFRYSHGIDASERVRLATSTASRRTGLVPSVYGSVPLSKPLTSWSRLRAHEEDAALMAPSFKEGPRGVFTCIPVPLHQRMTQEQVDDGSGFMAAVPTHSLAFTTVPHQIASFRKNGNEAQFYSFRRQLRLFEEACAEDVDNEQTKAEDEKNKVLRHQLSAVTCARLIDFPTQRESSIFHEIKSWSSLVYLKTNMDPRLFDFQYVTGGKHVLLWPKLTSLELQAKPTSDIGDSVAVVNNILPYVPQLTSLVLDGWKLDNVGVQQHFLEALERHQKMLKVLAFVSVSFACTTNWNVLKRLRCLTFKSCRIPNDNHGSSAFLHRILNTPEDTTCGDDDNDTTSMPQLEELEIDFAPDMINLMELLVGDSPSCPPQVGPGLGEMVINRDVASIPGAMSSFSNYLQHLSLSFQGAFGSISAEFISKIAQFRQLKSLELTGGLATFARGVSRSHTNGVLEALLDLLQNAPASLVHLDLSELRVEQPDELNMILEALGNRGKPLSYLRLANIQTNWQQILANGGTESLARIQPVALDLTGATLSTHGMKRVLTVLREKMDTWFMERLILDSTAAFIADWAPQLAELLSCHPTLLYVSCRNEWAINDANMEALSTIVHGAIANKGLRLTTNPAASLLQVSLFYALNLYERSGYYQSAAASKVNAFIHMKRRAHPAVLVDPETQEAHQH